jgi:hypothetical protein
VQRPKRVVSKAARGNRASAAKSTKREELTRGGNASLRGRQRGERENGLRVRKPEVGKRIRIVLTSRTLRVGGRRRCFSPAAI